MRSNENVHQSQLLTPGKGCDTAQDVPSQWPSVRWHSSNSLVATRPTQPFAYCAPFVCPLHSVGSVESCMRHTRSAQGWGRDWGLQSLLETGQSSEDVAH